MSNLKWYPIPNGVVGRSFPKLAVGNLYVVSYIDDPPRIRKVILIVTC